MTTAFTTHMTIAALALQFHSHFFQRLSTRAAVLVGAFTLLATCNVQAAAATQETSVDLYCKSLSFAFIDVYRYLNATSNSAKLENTGTAMEESCRNSPAIAPVPLVSMKPSQVTVVSCLGFATGAQLAHQVGLPTESYAMLSKRRDFALAACQSNPKRFQADVLKHGPDYVLQQKY